VYFLTKTFYLLSMYVFNPLINTQYLEEMYGDDISIIQIMFESFLEDSIPIWEKVLDAINNNDFKQVSEMTHQIKPSFSMVGFPFLHPKIQELELYAKENPDYSKLLSKYQSLSIDVKQAQFVIEEELKKLNEL
jgi:HPt (histidine-containing phosphotransfer) domain-containing protein